MIATLVASIAELFALFAVGTIGTTSVFVLGLFDMLFIGEEMDSVVYAMDLYYRAMHGDEKAEQALENYNAVKGTTILVISMLFGVLNKMLAREGAETKLEDIPGESDIFTTIKDLQTKTPQKLMEEEWQDVTNPKMAENTNCREFFDSKTRLKIRFDKGVKGANGFEALDHYHVYNPNYTNKKIDYYLDINGNPVGKGSNASHIVIGEN